MYRMLWACQCKVMSVPGTDFITDSGGEGVYAYISQGMVTNTIGRFHYL